MADDVASVARSAYGFFWVAVVLDSALRLDWELGIGILSWVVGVRWCTFVGIFQV